LITDARPFIKANGGTKSIIAELGLIHRKVIPASIEAAFVVFIVYGCGSVSTKIKKNVYDPIYPGQIGVTVKRF
jgi:hypothetical protein